jgi:hypothetical protein
MKLLFYSPLSLKQLPTFSGSLEALGSLNLQAKQVED